MACSQLSIGANAARCARAALFGSLLAAALVVTVIAPSGTAAGARRNDVGRTSVTLVTQTNWVTGSSMSLHLAIRSSEPSSELGLKLIVYSRLTTRYAFGLSESGKQAPNELVLDSTPIIPLHALTVTGTGTETLGVAIHVRVTITAAAGPRPLGSPELALDCPKLACDGVYPLEVTVVDTANDTALTSFTTFLVYVAGQPGSTPLRVALVLPFGVAPTLDAAGASTLTTREISSLAATLSSILRDHDSRLTLEVYSQLLAALAETPSHTAKVVLAELRTLVKRWHSSRTVEFLEAPFTPVNLDTLTSAGMSSELDSQLSRAASVFRTTLVAAPSWSTYLSTTPIDNTSLADLVKEHVKRVVIPDAGLPVTGPMNRWSPLRLNSSPAKSSTPAAVGLPAVVADSSLATHFASDADPALAAHRFLAEVAQIYFEEPFGAQARGVVVAPAELPKSPTFLRDVLTGLHTSPIAEQATVASIFATIPVGADGAPQRVTTVPNPSMPSYLFVTSLQNAVSAQTAIESIVPGDTSFLAKVKDAVLLTETSGLERSVWASYAAEPLTAISEIERAISVSGARTVTLTQRTANVPITIVSTFPSPIHTILQLASSTLVIASRDQDRALVLAHKNSPLEIPVTARTSGVSTIGIQLTSPRGGIVLFEDVYTVRSTAFSIVAVALSAAALAVLALWWLRSHFRRRRRRTRDLAAAGHLLANKE
ncbi:MAG TPA: DUF6049 family protein [Acidimicrobiales bacterium]|nr:DUF6049 family protein [Acidimicrobiales bacterium]